MLNVNDFVTAIHKEFDLNMTIERALKEYKGFLVGKCDFRYNNFDYILQNFDIKPLITRSDVDDLSPKKHYHLLHLLRSIDSGFDKKLLHDVFERDDVDPKELVKFMPTNSYEISFPFDSMRDIQRNMFSQMEAYLKDPDITDIIIDAPTGVGKSGIAIASLLKEGSGYLVTANKALQNQYANEFGWLADLRGKANYKCRCHEGHNCKNSPCQKTKESREECKNNGGCDYGATKRKVLKTSNYSLMNMHTLIAYSVYVSDALSKRDILVIDEAHSLPEVISSSVGLTLQLKSLLPFGINDIPVFSRPESYDSWLETVLEVLGDEPELDEDDEQLVHKIQVIKEQLGSGNIALDFEYDKDNKNIVTALKLHPIRVEEYFEKIREIAPIRIHLSATILGYQTYCSMLGIKENNVGIIRANSPFPKERRPIYINHSVGSINMQNLSYVTPRIVSNIEHLLEHYSDYKGIIHGVTYNICNNIYGNLNPKYKSRILFPRMAKEQAEMLAKHKESKNTVLLSPSMTEGVDLKDNLSRFQILVKTPYPYLGDPILQKRKEIYHGYYEMLTATTIMQSYGRSVRSVEDWCHTFVLDDNFYKFVCINRGIFPQWFVDAIVR